MTNNYNAAMQALIDQGKMPSAIRNLPITDKGFPFLWFAATIDGKPDLRVAGPGKIQIAWQAKRCWICGGIMGKYRTFVIGPMCTVNRVSSEPPCHSDCATFSAIACPFLTKPAMTRNGHRLPNQIQDPAGVMIPRNPGVTALWTSTDSKLIRVHNGNLFDIGTPTKVEWYAQARQATRGEVEAAMESGLPALLDTLKMEREERRDEARDAIYAMLNEAERFLPAA